MNISPALTLLVALTVLFAGCTGLQDATSGDGGAAPSSGTGDGSPADDGASGSDGSGGESVSDSSEFTVADSEQALREAGSFTATWTFESTDANGTQSSMSSAYAVDLEAERSLETLSITGEGEDMAFERFYADGKLHAKLGEGDSTFYQITPDDTDLVENALSRAITGYDDMDGAQFAGSETFDGVQVDRYEYADPIAWRQYGAGAFATEDSVTVTDFTLVVLVDDSGLARLTEWTVTGETDDGDTVSATWRYTVTDVGSTAVDDPDWLDEATAQGQTMGGN